MVGNGSAVRMNLHYNSQLQANVSPFWLFFCSYRRKYVEKDLFDNQEPPVRHDLSYFPTVNDLKNHIHTALADIETGTLPLREVSLIYT